MTSANKCTRPAEPSLAWPVTSLLLARRRREGRGFAVEPAADTAPPAIDPPPALSARP